MSVNRGYKYELKVNNKERTLLAMYAGTARFAWNWGLAQRLTRYKENEEKERYTDAMKQHRALNVLKKSDFSWMYQVSKCVPQEALRDLQKAFENFFNDLKKRRKTGSKPQVGFPKLKKKGQCKDKFRLTGTIKVFPEAQIVQLPRLKKLRLKEKPNLHPSANILSATVSRTADRWYVSLGVMEEDQELPEKCCAPETLVGIDAGLAKFMVLSSGLYVPRLKFLHRRLRKLRRLSESGKLNYHFVDNLETVAGTMDTFIRMFAESRPDKATFLTGQRESFFRLLADTMARAGLLQLGVLELDDQPTAMIMCFDYNDCRYLYNSGYDPEYNSLSVGLLSKVLAIKDSIQRGIKSFDFLKGAEAYKYHLGGKEVPLYRCQITIK